ncbi:DUF2281 domain-containing protein [Fortiea contorta]|uniref:DUF2281 domain-containing protein n=1 Tax=Fortiea contorta TaxID=1892405 RepID=UPI00034CBC7D|nr:DUF2281 domain-containing protein [Fortiea contorta]
MALDFSGQNLRGRNFKGKDLIKVKGCVNTGVTMTIKEQITQELEKLPEPLLQEILDFVQFLQTKHQPIGISVNNQPEQTLIAEHTLTGSTAQDLLEFVGTWSGSDIRKCLQLVHESRIPLEF